MVMHDMKNRFDATRNPNAVTTVSYNYSDDNGQTWIPINEEFDMPPGEHPQHLVHIKGEWWLEPMHQRVRSLERHGTHATALTDQGRYFVMNVPPEPTDEAPRKRWWQFWR